MMFYTLKTGMTINLATVAFISHTAEPMTLNLHYDQGTRVPVTDPDDVAAILAFTNKRENSLIRRVA